MTNILQKIAQDLLDNEGRDSNRHIDYEKSQIAKFYPDFIFWLKKDELIDKYVEFNFDEIF